MKTTVNINLSGQSFVIDDDAFQHLSVYLNNIKSRFKSEAEGKEVIEDIEARIAELFVERSGSNRAVVGMQQVEAVIAKLGKPEDIFMEEESEEAQKHQGNSFSGVSGRKNRRLFRNPDDKKVSGLLSGVALYLGLTEPSWLRIIFVILCVFSFGTLALPLIAIYLGLSAIIPLAETASEKLQMRGEDVNLNNIKRTVQQDMSRSGNSNPSAGQKFIDGVIELIHRIFQWLPKLIAVFAIFISVSMLFGVIVGFMGLEMGSVSELASIIIKSKEEAQVAIFGFLLFFSIPCISIIYYAFRILLGSTVRKPGLSWVLFGLWMSGLIMLSYAGIRTGGEYARGSSIARSEVLPMIESDTLYIATNNKQELQHNGVNFNMYHYNIDGLSIHDGEIFMTEAALHINKGTDKFELITQQEARGNSEEAAHSRAKNIKHEINLNGNRLFIDNFISFPFADKYRVQQANLELKVPVGKVIYLDVNTRHLIDDIKNVTNTYDGDMIGHYWIMTEQGLKCLDKDFTKDEDDVEDKIEDKLDSVEANLDKIEDVKMNLNKNGIDIQVKKKGEGEDAHIVIKANEKEGASVIVKDNEQVIIKK